MNFTGFNQNNHNNNAVNSAFKSNTASNFNSNENNKLISKENQTSNNTNYYGFQNNSFSNNREVKERKGEMRLGKEDKSIKSKVDGDLELDAILLGNTGLKEKRSNSHSHTQSQKDKKYSKTELLQMEKEYDAIKKDQIELKQKLHNYQKEFYQQHNRKVKYYKDIIGMENEYQAYKENKQRLRQILDVLEKYRNANCWTDSFALWIIQAGWACFFKLFISILLKFILNQINKKTLMKAVLYSINEFNLSINLSY